VNGVAPRIGEILARYGRTLVGEPLPVPDSVLNHNFRAETEAGPLFVRIHRERPRALLEVEDEVVRWVQRRGIPAVRALRDGTSRWLHTVGGDTFSVYPWIDGVKADQGGLSPTQARSLGEMHARIHRALRDFVDPRLPADGTHTRWDTEGSIAVLSRVDDLIRYYPSPGEERLRIQESLRAQLALLESGEARPSADFAGVRLQASHGDYHERNVLFGPAGDILAVVDWELTRMISPGFELLRALTFSGLLDQPGLGAYLAGYSSRSRLSRADCEVAMEVWWQSRIHSTWGYRQTFIEGDGRAARFIAQGAEQLSRFSDHRFRQGLLATLTGALSSR